MIINYPTYYLVPPAPIMSLFEDELNNPYNTEDKSRCIMEDNVVYNSYRNINEDMFYEIDEDYVNETLKQK